MRDLLRAGSSALLLVLMMFVGSLVLWIGVPLGWLYVGSQVQGATGSLGAALAVMAAGVVVSILVLMALLGWMSRRHGELRHSRGLENGGHVALEGIMVVSAAVALIAFAAWFLLFSGSSPIPFQGRGT
jgi:hypothetical protein